MPFGFKDIAVRSTEHDSGVFGYSKTYMTYLWNRFRNIKKAFAERIETLMGNERVKWVGIVNKKPDDKKSD